MSKELKLNQLKQAVEQDPQALRTLINLAENFKGANKMDRLALRTTFKDVLKADTLNLSPKEASDLDLLVVDIVSKRDHNKLYKQIQHFELIK